jgi:hypothetical protein
MISLTKLKINAGIINKKEKMRAIAYSMDLMFPGLYIWFFGLSFRIGGETPDDDPYKYPGMINAPIGIGLVLRGYKIFTTYRGSYDPEET